MGTILKGRVALVTGAVGGIGRAISLHLAQEGAILALNYLLEREQDAEDFLKELTGQGYRAKLYKTDVSRFDEAVRLVETITKDLGPVDVLINNAGITIDKTLKNMSPEQWQKVIGVDLDSVFYCSRAVIEQMLGRGYGQTNYAAAKAAIIGFTKALALETAKKGITVNAIAPGFVKTAMTEKIPKDVMDKIVESIPVGRLAEPSEIARAIVFLADDKSSYITGQVMGINGGFYM